MRKLFASILAIFIGLLSIIPFSIPLTAADTIYESYTTGDDNGQGIYTGGDGTWYAQSFTPSTSHYITSVDLYMGGKTGSPPWYIVSIRSTITSVDLCSGMFPGSSITSGTGAWVNCPLNGANLTASTTYYICVRASGGNISNYGRWRADFSSSTYSGGKPYSSTNGGYTWTADPFGGTADFLFREYGGDVIISDIPTAPTSLSATWNYDYHGMFTKNWLPSLTWTDNSSGSNEETIWVIEKATNNSFTENAVTSEIVENASTPPVFDNFSGWTTGNPTTLYYRVAGKNRFGTSSWSNTASLTVGAGYGDIIPRVENLHGALHITQNIPSYILLEWDTYVGSATGFYIQRCSNQNFTGIVYHFVNQYENNPLYPTLNDDAFVAFTDIYGIGNLNEAGTWYYRIMARNVLGSNTVVINTNPNSPSITVIGSEWSNVASISLTQQNLDDINVIPQPTINPPTTNPFPVNFSFFGNAAFPYIALLVSALALFAIAAVVGHGHAASLYVGLALAAADLGVFTAMSWINPIPLVVVIAAAVIFLVVKLVPTQGQ